MTPQSERVRAAHPLPPLPVVHRYVTLGVIMHAPMKILATIASPGDRDYRVVMLPLLHAIASTFPGALDYFARTWQPETGAEVVQVLLDGGEEPATMEVVLRRIFGSREVTLEQLAAADVPSPLWNAGVGGRGLTSISRWLYREATPIMTELIGTWQTNADGQVSLDTALRLMVAHGSATLHSSPQTRMPGYTERRLLTLRLLSYRSHFESVFARATRSAEFEAACERSYVLVGQTARRAIDAAPGGPQGHDAASESWGQLVRTAHTSLMSAFHRGELVGASKTLEDLERETGRTLPRTRFHASMSPAVRALLYEDDDFLAFRLETGLLYSVLFTLGYSLAERYVLCYVVARANEDLAQRTADELRDELDALAVLIANGVAASQSGAPSPKEVMAP